tara:strand:- start:3385 stop:6213 length:2829 start_codon:yes stop_codon:yes gene_type:complete
MLQKKRHTKSLDVTAGELESPTDGRERLLKSVALQLAIINSANFSSIATDEKGVIQLFNIGAERMLGYAAVDVINKITPATISDPDELVLRAKALSVEFDTLIKPGFETLVYKAARGIEDIYELTYICQDGSFLPAVVSVTALRDAQNTLIGYLLIATDNTARKQIELKQDEFDQQLLDQQLYVQSLIESISDALTVIDPTGIITDANKQMELLTGCTRDELVGTPFADHFTNQKRAKAGFKRILSKKTILNFELIVRAKNGVKTTVSYSGSTFYDREQKLQGVLAAARDMTEQKQAALYARSLREASLDPLVTISPAGKITDVNEATVKATGVKRKKLIGTDFSDYFTDVTKACKGYQKAFDRGRVTNYPLTIRDPSGRLTDVLYNASVYKDPSKKTLGVFAAARDVTGQKQSLLYTRSLIEASLDPLVTISPAGKITDVNEAAVKMSGVKRKKLIGSEFSGYFTDTKKARGGYQKAFAKGNVTDYPLTFRGPDGLLIDILYNASVYENSGGAPLGVVATARDVTESNHLARVLEEKNVELEIATAAAEKANLAKSDFLFSMSHELRTPLNAILGYAQLMERDNSQPPSPGQQDSISQILEAGWHLLTLINEVLDLAKIESGEVPLTQEPVSLAATMLECLSMIEPQAQKGGIAISFPPPDMNYFVQADQVRVKQVLINFLSNAIKYNSEQGTVEVSCSESTPGLVRVSVRDTGAGLSPEAQTQLFQPFNRLGKESSAEEGTGIGLVVCKRLIELMDGSIGLNSSVGVGSVFWFELPSVPKPQLITANDKDVVAQQLEQPSHLARPYNLLYIEDNPANMKLFEKIIARYANIKLQTAVNGTIGTAHALKYLPDVIVTDIDMPGISGFDVLQSLRENPVTAHIPIIALSAKAIPKEVELGLQAGFFCYLTKPIKLGEFMKSQIWALKYVDEQANKKNKDSKL